MTRFYIHIDGKTFVLKADVRPPSIGEAVVVTEGQIARVVDVFTNPYTGTVAAVLQSDGIDPHDLIESEWECDE